MVIFIAWNFQYFTFYASELYEVFRFSFSFLTGNVKDWHGNLDIVLDGCDLPVKVLEKLPEIPRGQSSVDAESSDMCTNVESQLIAQTIVYSFLQKKKHPECNNFLIPSIAISKTSVIFYMYDSKNDVLLKSAVFPIFKRDKTINTVTVLAIWFVLNYKYLCSGFSEEHIENHVKKSRFFEMTDSLLPIYKNELAYGGNIRITKKDTRLFEPWHLRECEFLLPPSKRLKTNLC